MINFEQIIKNGNFYFPAWTHYNKSDANVTCDRCRRTNLKCCIGYNNYDLCLDCTEDVVQILNRPIKPIQPTYEPIIMTEMEQNFIKPSQLRTRMEQEFIRPQMKTKMAQRMYNDNTITKMAQRMYNDNTITKMAQNMFEDDIMIRNRGGNGMDETKTFMRQRMFNLNNRGGNNINDFDEFRIGKSGRIDKK